MKRIIIVFYAVMVCYLPISAQQIDPCEQEGPLIGGTTHTITTEWQKIGLVDGTDYEYELWHNADYSKNPVSIKIYGVDQGGGAAFRGEWNEQNTKFDYLARIGYKFEKNGAGSGKLYPEYGNIYVDYRYDRSPRLTGSNYSYIGVYGWARAGDGANLVEFYIVDDWWGNQYTDDKTPVDENTTGGDIVESFVTDGAAYQVIKNKREGEPSIEGNSSNFDQYFSIRQVPRKCGRISVTEHFKAWDRMNLKLGKLYETKILAEVGAYSASNTTGWIDYTYAKMTMSDVALKPPQTTTCETPLITYPTSTVPTNPYTACFKYTNDKCYVCKVENEGDFEGQVNTCASAWVWDGSQIEANLESGFWYYEVPCPATNYILNSQLSIFSDSPIYYSLQGKLLGGTKPEKPGIYIVKINGMSKKVVVNSR